MAEFLLGAGQEVWNIVTSTYWYMAVVGFAVAQIALEKKFGKGDE